MRILGYVEVDHLRRLGIRRIVRARHQHVLDTVRQAVGDVRIDREEIPVKSLSGNIERQSVPCPLAELLDIERIVCRSGAGR